ncbi:MAG: XdhC/CoxI family protein [Elusimicrobiota bacterium]
MESEENVHRLFAEAREAGRSAALVTIVSAEGSTPREIGAKMLVYPDGSTVGTVGGGRLEALCIKESLRCIREGRSRKVRFELKEDGIGMACMGTVEAFIDVYREDVRLLILGAGHVGERIAAVAALAGLPYSVADDRPEFANPERFPRASGILVKKPHQALKAAGVDERTYVVIVTRGHELDAECLQAALGTKAAYIGMIGSRSKVPAMLRRAKRNGRPAASDPRVFSPIGLDLGGKSPGAIAVSVVAEILKLHHARSGRHLALRGG